jgi:hypothetical protein
VLRPPLTRKAPYKPDAVAPHERGWETGRWPSAPSCRAHPRLYLLIEQSEAPNVPLCGVLRPFPMAVGTRGERLVFEYTALVRPQSAQRAARAERGVRQVRADENTGDGGKPGQTAERADPADVIGREVVDDP